MTGRDGGEEMGAGRAATAADDVDAAYERVSRLADAGLAALRRGDWETFTRLLGERRGVMEEVAGRRATAKAGGAIQRALAVDGEVLALLDSVRGRLAGELAELARGGAGLESYRGGAESSRLLDRKG